MGTETYAKNGQVSKKDHGGKGQQSKEHYHGSKYEPNPTMGGGPDGYDRSMDSNYRKKSLPSGE